MVGDWVLEVAENTDQILGELRSRGLAARTLVIFNGDHGGAPEHGSPNGPLRGGKGSMWEGGMHVPTIAWWPGRILAGTRADPISTMMDILPTSARLAGATLPAWRRMDGVDIGPVLRGGTVASA
ncbi:MAG: sulfatase-like hydrolase/transferase [Kiritimatiellae bacterium]|nr:sulfatase-like hydrolase/transferase [Kiritimatiellia bacterium]